MSCFIVKTGFKTTGAVISMINILVGKPVLYMEYSFALEAVILPSQEAVEFIVQSL